MSSSELTTSRRRFRLDLAYDGAGLHGFAEQPGELTVVGLLRDALATTLRMERPLIVGAGRTDAGVHALGQVVHFDYDGNALNSDDDRARVTRSLNAQLHGAVVVERVSEVDSQFHARFSAQWRHYRYLLVDGVSTVPNSVSALAWVVPHSLNVDAMNAAAGLLLGEHDFRSFCRRAPETTTDDEIRRNVLISVVSESGDPLGLLGASGRFLRYDVRANAFCHQMVRSIVGTLVAVGTRRMTPDEVSVRLAAASRNGMPAPAPASGLCLMAVGYPHAG